MLSREFTRWALFPYSRYGIMQLLSTFSGNGAVLKCLRNLAKKIKAAKMLEKHKLCKQNGPLKGWKNKNMDFKGALKMLEKA